MSDRQLEKDLKRWKDKYFTLSEETEKDLRQHQEMSDLLQRLVVRVSLAAQGQHKGLDTELDVLRQLLRNDPLDRRQLVDHLAKVEKAVLGLDQQKDQQSDSLLSSLSVLIQQMQALELSSAPKKALRSLERDLKNDAALLQIFPNLLSRYSDIQKQALSEAFGEVSSPEKEGFLSRVLGLRRQQAASGAADSAVEPDVQSETQAATELDVTASDEEHHVPGFSTISDHVSSALRNLLEQLPLPPGSAGDVEKVRQQIESGLNWYELGPTLDDIANLVISAVGKGQRDFQSFLLSMDERLTRIHQFLSLNQLQQQARKEAGAALDEAVREHVKSISTEVANAIDLDSLRVSVESHLDTIMTSMDQFVTSEISREQQMAEQMQEMQARLQAMEQEAASIQVRLQEERQRAMTDVLTRLPNREAFDERLEMEFERWKRYRQPVTLAVADIDFFKRVNDQYGHLAGDKVIQIIAAEIKKRIRKTDFVARYGGEEFVILMPETDEAAALGVIEKAREMIARLPFHFRNERVQITMSAGLIEFAGDQDAWSFFEQADQALYKAKQNGRNRVEIANAELAE